MKGHGRCAVLIYVGQPSCDGSYAQTQKMFVTWILAIGCQDWNRIQPCSLPPTSAQESCCRTSVCICDLLSRIHVALSLAIHLWAWAGDMAHQRKVAANAAPPQRLCSGSRFQAARTRSVVLQRPLPAPVRGQLSIIGEVADSQSGAHVGPMRNGGHEGKHCVQRSAGRVLEAIVPDHTQLPHGHVKMLAQACEYFKHPSARTSYKASPVASKRGR